VAVRESLYWIVFAAQIHPINPTTSPIHSAPSPKPSSLSLSLSLLIACSIVSPVLRSRRPPSPPLRYHPRPSPPIPVSLRHRLHLHCNGRLCCLSAFSISILVSGAVSDRFVPLPRPAPAPARRLCCAPLLHSSFPPSCLCSYSRPAPTDGRQTSSPAASLSHLSPSLPFALFLQRPRHADTCQRTKTKSLL
jgi:hypothetical protein